MYSYTVDVLSEIRRAMDFATVENEDFQRR